MQVSGLWRLIGGARRSARCPRVFSDPAFVSMKSWVRGASAWFSDHPQNTRLRCAWILTGTAKLQKHSQIMPNSHWNERNFRAMIGLVGEVRSLKPNHADARSHLMDGIKRMIDADCWVWTVGYLDPAKPPAYVAIQHEGLDDERLAHFLQTLEHPEMAALTTPSAGDAIRRLRTQATKLLRKFNSDHHPASAVTNPLWRKPGILPGLLSAHLLDERRVSIIAIYRRQDQPHFSQRDRRFAHILMGAVGWLHTEGWPHEYSAGVPTLPRSRTRVLDILLEGHGRKQVADQLGLSPHTVSGYIKDIYRVFQVHSHAELMRRFAKMNASS